MHGSGCFLPIFFFLLDCLFILFLICLKEFVTYAEYVTNLELMYVANIFPLVVACFLLSYYSNKRSS